MDRPFNIRVCALDSGICMQSVDESQAIESFKQPDRVAWLHIVYQDRDAVSEFLEDALGFHELAVEDSLSDIERPTLHQYDDHLFLSASQVYSENGHENYTEIGFFLTNSALVTVAPREIPLVDSWIERWQKNPVHVGKRPVDLLHAVIDSVVDEYYLVAEKIEDEVDDLIDSISQGDNSQLQVLLNLKRRLNMLRRHVTPMRDIMNGLLRRDVTLIPADSRADFQDVYDHTLRLTELADINRDTLTSTLDVHLSTVSNNLNNVMKKMTVISTVLMSAALIAGIYGMNFKYMPELHWWFGYPFAILLMVVSGLLILGLFKLKRWI